MNSVWESSDRVSAEEALRRSEARFRGLFDVGPLGIVVYSQSDGRLVEVNKRFCEMLRYSAEELKGKFASEISNQEDFSAQLEKINEAIKKKEDTLSFEKRYVRKDGSTFWARVVVKLFEEEEDGKKLAIGVVEDITELRIANAKVERYEARLRKLALELVHVEERERRRIAAGLHDEVVQMLAMCRYKTHSLQNPSSLDGVIEQAKMLDSLIEGCIERTRSLMFELSPPVLHELGLKSALEWLSEQLRRTCDMKCQLTFSGSESGVSAEQRVFVFQAARELLMNVRKHSKVNSAELEVSISEERLEVVVSDQGIGFKSVEVESGGSGSSGMGLFSLRERLRSLGGEIEIKSSIGNGCIVVFWIPLAHC